MPIAEIIRLFDLPGVNQSNARFDDKKLAHMNMVYLLELPADRFVALARDYFQKQHADAPALAADAGYFREVMLLSQPKIKGSRNCRPTPAIFSPRTFRSTPR